MLYVFTCMFAIQWIHGVIVSPRGIETSRRLCQERVGCTQVRFWAPSRTCCMDVDMDSSICTGMNYHEANRTECSTHELCHEGWRNFVIRGNINTCRPEDGRQKPRLEKANISSLLSIPKTSQGQKGYVWSMETSEETPYNYIKFPEISAIASNRRLKKMYIAERNGRLVSQYHYNETFEVLSQRKMQVNAMTVDEVLDILIFATPSFMCIVDGRTEKQIKTSRNDISITVDPNRRNIYSCDSKNVYVTTYPVLKTRMLFGNTGTTCVSMSPNYDVLYYNDNRFLSSYSKYSYIRKALHRLNSDLTNMIADNDRVYYGLKQGLMYEYNLPLGKSYWVKTKLKSSELFVELI